MHVYLVLNTDRSESEGTIIYGVFADAWAAERWIVRNYPDNFAAFDIDKWEVEK